MVKGVAFTDKIKSKLEEVSSSQNVGEEALANIILMLGLCNDELVKTAVNLIKAWKLGGATALEKMGL